jgi:signal-transduction protein with cAMP-binding, CBS, and nucleotidyltransferase domain
VTHPDEAAEFLVRFPPFAQLGAARVADVARHVRLESYDPGETILQQGAEPAPGLFVVRAGVLDLYDDDRPVDHLGEGEVFGISVLSGLGPAFSVRARERASCYLIDPGHSRELLGTTEGLAYLATSVNRWAEKASVEHHVRRAGSAGDDLIATIRAAGHVDDVVTASVRLPDTIRSLLADGVEPVDVGHVVGSTIDELTRRLVELSIAAIGEPPCAFAWMGLGSAARHEQALVTDQDHAIAYGCGDDELDGIDPYFARLATGVTDGLEACGIARCRGNVMAENPAWRRTETGWRRRFELYVSDPDPMAARITGIAFDYRRVTGAVDIEPTIDEVIRGASMDRAFIGRLRSTVLESRPPVGRVRDLVVERGGDHAGALDLKHGGITIVTNLARFYAIVGGVTLNRTVERLHGAASLGVIPERLRDDLEEAFRFLWGLRLHHHVDQVERGGQVDDFVDPDSLSPIQHRTLSAALHVVAEAVTDLDKHRPERTRPRP